MKNRSHLVPSFILLAYAVVYISGPTFHQHLCDHSDTDCCVHVETIDPHASFNANSSDCLLQSSNDITAYCLPDNGTIPADGNSDCWTCYVLAQAGDVSFEITIDVSHHFVYFAAATYEHRHLPLNTHKFLVRGPPEIHSPTS